LKKFFIIFAIIVGLIFATIYFTTTEYFFNKYVATNIKEYNFDYKRAQGSLLSGFKIEDLKYKNQELSSNVEFKFNPVKLLKGTISISKLHLENVDKKVLTNVINDFKRDDNNSSSSLNSIPFNFEFRDILLTIKPFNFKGLEINKNRLEIEYLSYMNGKFSLGNSRYLYKTNLGDIDFVGKFGDKVLYVDKIELLNLDINKLLSFVDSLKSSKKTDNNSTDVISFLPQKIFLESIKISLKPFEIDGILAKDLRLVGKEAVFNVEKLMLERANLNLEYLSDLASIKTNLAFENSDLNISKLSVDIIKPNKLESIIKSKSTNKKSDKNIDILAIFPIKRVNIESFDFGIKNYKYNKDKIENIVLNSNKIFYDINSTKLKINKAELKAKSSITNINISASIKDKIYIDKLNIKATNADKIKNMLSFNDTNNTMPKINIPELILLKDSNITFNKLSFKPYIIKKAKIEAKNIEINSTKFAINKGELKLYSLSNWGESRLKGNIKKSTFYAKGSTNLTQELFKEYNLPIRAKNLERLKVKGKFSFSSLELNTTLKGKDILTKVENLDILDSTNLVKYNYKSSDVTWKTDALINTPYTQKAKLKNTLIYRQKKLKYSGELKAIEIVNRFKDYNKLLNGLNAKYKGDNSSIELDINTNKLKGELISKGYKKALFKITNKESIRVNDIYNLGDKFKKASISKIDIQAPIDFLKPLPINGKLLVKSNLADIKGKVGYENSFFADLNIVNPKLNIKNLNYKALFPLNLKLKANKDIDIALKNSFLSSNIKYKSNYLDIKFKSNSISAKASGDINNIKGDIKSKDLYKTLKEINKIYKIKNLPKVKGALSLKLNIKDLKRFNILATSNKIEYFDKKESTKIENILIDTIYTKSGDIILNRYKLKAKGYTIYANKSTKIAVDKNRLIFKNFWINDSATLNGNYNINTQKGKLSLNSRSFKIDSSDAKMNLKLNTKIDINKNRYAISGLIDILKATIKKNLTNKSVTDNEDIIILQKQRAKKSTNYAKNVKLDLKVISKGGIIYSQPGTYFKMYPKLKVKKRYGSLTAISGTIKLDKSSYYKFRDKKLKLQKGVITFKGKSSTPYLNIVMLYRGKEYTIYINISGTPARPIIYFSSNPPLTKDEILAYLLFGDSTAAGTHSQQSMLNLIGGTLAKSFFGAIGLKIDHISIKENGFSIGKSINDKVTIFYNQEGDKPSIKTRIDITKSIHTDIEIGEESQSADIIFSKEY